MERSHRFVVVTALASLALAAAPWACSPNASAPESSSFDTGTGGSQSGTGGGGGAGATQGTGGAGGEIIVDVDSGVPDPDAACGLVTENGNRTPLNLYVMLDQSASMSGFRWTAATTGLEALAADPASAGIRLALKLFPRAPDNDPVCDALPYKVPDVPFGELPGNASAIAAALSGEPNGFSTPIYPALSGGLLKGIELVKNNPEETSAVLLVTDGEPEGACEKDPVKIVEMAKNGAAKHVLTYVIGLPGVNPTLANEIAAAGGTGKAIVIGKENVEADFVKALAKVRGEALPCSYALPSKVGSDFDVNQVNVLFTDNGGTTNVIAQDEACTGEGWHYDDAANPTEIVLCPASCALAKDAGTGKIQVLLGCKTQIK
jgi:hypothetical protein